MGWSISSAGRCWALSRAAMVLLATALLFGAILINPAPAGAQSFSGSTTATAGTVTHAVLHRNVLTTVSESATGGSIFLSSRGPYRYGQVIGASATPDPGFVFAGWSATGSSTLSDSTAARTTLAVYDNFSLTAGFTPIQYTLTTLAGPSAAGSVGITPSLASFHYGDVVRIDAVSNPGYLFANWAVSGGVVDSTRNYWTYLTIRNNCTLTASFARAAFNGTVAVTGGTISLSRPGPYTYGQVITVTATPSSGLYFNGWNATGVALLNNWTATTVSLTVGGDFTLSAFFSTSANQPAPRPNVILWPADWLGLYHLDGGGPISTAAAKAHLAALKAAGANYDWVSCPGFFVRGFLGPFLTWSASMIRSAGLKVGMETALNGDLASVIIPYVSSSGTDYTNDVGYLQADAVCFDVEYNPADNHGFQSNSYAQLMSLANSLVASCQWNPGVTTPVYFFNTGYYFPQAAGSGACPADYQWFLAADASELPDDQACYAVFTGSSGAYEISMNTTLSTPWTDASFPWDPVANNTKGYYWFAIDSKDGSGDDIKLSPYLLGKLCTFLKSEGWPGVVLFPGPIGYSATFSQDTTAFWEARAMSLVKTAVCSFAGSPYQVALLASGNARPAATGPFAWAGTEPDYSNPAQSHPYYVSQTNSALPPWLYSPPLPAGWTYPSQLYYYLRHIDSGWAITTNSPGLIYCDLGAACWTRSGDGDDLTGMLGDYSAYQNASGTLHVAADPPCTLTAGANQPDWGTVAVTPSQAFYAPNSTVQLVARPNPGRRFTGWTATGGRLLNAHSPATTLTLDGRPCQLTANFAR